MKKKLGVLFYRPESLFLVFILLFGFFFTVAPAYGQTTASISIEPTQSDLYFNGANSVTVEVWVRNVVNINTFDITFHYDPSIIQFDSWQHGGILTNLYQLRNIHDPIAGTLRLSYVQQGGAGYTGSGVLLRLTFSGLAVGESFLNMNPAGLWSAGVEVLPLTINNGTIVTGYQPGVIVNTTLSGSIDLQGRVDRGGIPVTLSEAQFVGQGPYTVPTTNVSGDNLAFTDVAMDVYTVSTNQARYLNITPEMGKQKALLASGNVLAPLRLLGGNAIWTDNVINAQDLALVAGELGKSTFNADADINGNGKVDIFDLALVAGNFGMTSAVAYAGWTP